MQFEINYFYDDPWAGQVEETATVTGDWTDLMKYMSDLESMGCYGITATDTTPAYWENVLIADKGDEI